MTEVVLITGCASGIGKALALEMHRRRLEDGRPAFKVYASDYRFEVVKDLLADGLEVLEMDVTKQESIDAAVAEVIKNEGRIDVVVCNAGISAAGYLAEMDYSAAERLFKVNVHGVFRTIQAVVKPMMARYSGKIVIMGSTNAYFSPICNGVYSGAKSAVHLMANALEMEVRPFGVSVTTVIPGWVRSDIINNAAPNYGRYERPGSFYEHSVPALKVLREGGIKHGGTTQEAAIDIANGIMRQPRPKRHIYTGKMLFYSLFWGYVQVWLRPEGMAHKLQGHYNLAECAEKGPTVWEGPYQKPPPPPPPPIDEPAESSATDKSPEFVTVDAPAESVAPLVQASA